MKIWAGCALLAMLAVPVMAMAAEPRKPGEYPPTADSIPQPGVPKGKVVGPSPIGAKTKELFAAMDNLQRVSGEIAAEKKK